MGGQSREAERISNAFLLSSSLSFGQSPRRGKSLLWLFSAFPLLLPASSFSYRYGPSVKGPKKLPSYFFGEEELYPSLLGGSVFEPTKDYSSSKRHYDLLATNNKTRHLFLYPFFVT